MIDRVTLDIVGSPAPTFTIPDASGLAPLEFHLGPVPQASHSASEIPQPSPDVVARFQAAMAEPAATPTMPSSATSVSPEATPRQLDAGAALGQDIRQATTDNAARLPAAEIQTQAVESVPLDATETRQPAATRTNPLPATDVPTIGRTYDNGMATRPDAMPCPTDAGSATSQDTRQPTVVTSARQPITAHTPAHPTAAAQPAADHTPAHPTAAAQPAVDHTPAHPTAAAQPAADHIPAQPTAATKPVAADIPAQPTAAAQPVAADIPTQPTAAAQPATADIPAQPTAATKPVAADIPQANPGTPTIREPADVEMADGVYTPKTVEGRLDKPAAMPSQDEDGIRIGKGVRLTADDKQVVQASDSIAQPLQAAPVVVPVAPDAAPTAVAGAVSIEIDPAAATAKTRELVDAAAQVADTILVTPSLVRGEGAITIQLKPTVLDGSEIRLEAKGSAITVAITPATPSVAQVIAQSQAQFEQALVERLPSFQIAVTMAPTKSVRRSETAT